MEETLNDLIMLNDTELSRIDLLLTGMDDTNPEREVLETLKQAQQKHVSWLKGLRHGIQEGLI